MGYGTLTDRAQHLERSAGFAQTFARYMVETDTDTADEALARVVGVSCDVVTGRTQAAEFAPRGVFVVIRAGPRRIGAHAVVPSSGPAGASRITLKVAHSTGSPGRGSRPQPPGRSHSYRGMGAAALPPFEEPTGQGAATWSGRLFLFRFVRERQRLC